MFDDGRSFKMDDELVKVWFNHFSKLATGRGKHKGCHAAPKLISFQDDDSLDI